VIEVLAEPADTISERTGAEVGSAFEDDAGGFAAGVGIEDVDLVHGVS
jgi:hypothetical protein